MKRLSVVSGVAAAWIGVASAATSPAVASPALGTSKEWTIEPPAGWEEDVEAANEVRDELSAKLPKVVNTEVRIWESAAPGGSLAVQWYVVSVSGNAMTMIDAFDRGVVKSIARSMTMQDQPSRIVGSMVIREARVDQLGGTAVNLRIVRRYQPAIDGLHGLIAMCAAPDPSPCDAAIDGMQFMVSHPISLDDSPRPVAFQIGQLVGLMLFVGVPLWIILAIRKRWRARAAVRAAARPGSPPGSGGAADGR